MDFICFYNVRVVSYVTTRFLQPLNRKNDVSPDEGDIAGNVI